MKSNTQSAILSRHDRITRRQLPQLFDCRLFSIIAMNLRLLICSCLLVCSFCKAATPGPKWHPGHYVYIAHDELTPEVLKLPHFRGVQKIYTWREFEPKEGQ